MTQALDIIGTTALDEAVSAKDEAENDKTKATSEAKAANSEAPEEEVTYRDYRNMLASEIFPSDRGPGRKHKFRFMSNSQRLDQNFIDRWSKVPCEIIITKDLGGDFWASSIEHIINALYLTVDDMHGVIILEGGENGWTIADALMKGCPGSFILCDMTDHFKQTAFPPTAFSRFVASKTSYNTIETLRFEGEEELIPDAVKDAFRYAQIVTAEVDAMEATEAASGAFSTYHCGDESGYARRCDVRHLYDHMSLGRLKLPMRSEYGIDEDAVVAKTNVPLVVGAPIAFTIPLLDNQREYVDALASATKKMEGVMMIWDALMSETPFSMNVSRVRCDSYDSRVIEDVARAVGVDVMVSALLDHQIPVKDLLAGKGFDL